MKITANRPLPSYSDARKSYSEARREGLPEDLITGS